MNKAYQLNVSVFSVLLILFTTARATEPQVSAGQYHNLALDMHGKVYWWGQQYGLSHYAGKPSPVQLPALVPGLPSASAVAAGTWHSVALAENGAVFKWGFSPYHMRNSRMTDVALGACETARKMWTGHGRDPCDVEIKASYAKVHLEAPVRVAGIPPIRAIAASDFVTAALGRDGFVYCWDATSPPQKIPGLEKIKAIRLGHFHGVAMREDGAVLTWGGNVNGELGSPPEAPLGGDSICRHPAPHVMFSDAIAIGASASTTYALRADGGVWGWGTNGGNKLDQADPKNEGKVAAPGKIAIIPDAAQIAGGLLHAVVLNSDGQVYAWGSNSFNSIWPGDTLLRSKVPVIIATLAAIRAIASDDHTLALTADGYVCVWGDNTYGAARPDSTLQNIPAPVPVMLADGKTPLQLSGNGPVVSDVNASICGTPDWRGKVAAWETAIAMQKQRLALLRENAARRWESERDLFRKVRSNETADVEQGSSALETAMAYKDYDAMRKLLADANVDVDAQDGLGWTTLMRAVSRADLESVNILLTARADPGLGNGMGIDPLSLARRGEHQSMIAVLESALRAVTAGGR